MDKSEQWVVKSGDKFCYFGSYHQVRLVDFPWKATLYNRKDHADKRAAEVSYLGYNNGPITSKEVVKVKLSFKEIENGS